MEIASYNFLKTDSILAYLIFKVQIAFLSTFLTWHPQYKIKKYHYTEDIDNSFFVKVQRKNFLFDHSS